MEKGAGPGDDEVVDLRLVEVGVVVLIGEGFLKDLTEKIKDNFKNIT